LEWKGNLFLFYLNFLWKSAHLENDEEKKRRDDEEKKMRKK
jgi:hypothetical protein